MLNKCDNWSYISLVTLLKGSYEQVTENPEDCVTAYLTGSCYYTEYIL